MKTVLLALPTVHINGTSGKYLLQGGVEARAAIAESEAMPLRYAAELIGMGTEDEKAIRWLIALIVLCCNPLAIPSTAAVSARRSTTT
jgi:hypothetical protein